MQDPPRCYKRVDRQDGSSLQKIIPPHFGALFRPRRKSARTGRQNLNEPHGPALASGFWNAVRLLRHAVVQSIVLDHENRLPNARDRDSLQPGER